MRFESVIPETFNLSMANTQVQSSELKGQFHFYLESLKNLTPQSLTEMTTFIIELGDSIKRLTEKPNKTEDDFERIDSMSVELHDFIKHLTDAQVTLRKKEWEDTEAYYQELKAKASKGDKMSAEVLKDFEPIYQEMQIKIRGDIR